MSLRALLVALVAVLALSPTASAATARERIAHQLTTAGQRTAATVDGRFTRATCDPLSEEPPGSNPRWWTYCAATISVPVYDDPSGGIVDDVRDVQWLVWVRPGKCLGRRGMSEDFSGKFNVRVFKRVRCVLYLPTSW